jgi:hypothetical protein
MSERSSGLARRLRRALIASGALFALVFTLLAGQLWLGHDPALGDGSGRGERAPRRTHASVLGTVLGLAASAVSDDAEGSSSSAPAPVRSQTS